jgi:hypothetical protein
VWQLLCSTRSPDTGPEKGPDMDEALLKQAARALADAYAQLRPALRCLLMS